MQSIYAMQQSQSDDIVKEEKFLKYSILKMFDLYVLNLLLINEVQKLAAKKIALSKKKILATKEDLIPNTKFLNNRLINTIQESVSLISYCEINKLKNWEVDDEYVRIIYDELLNSKIYKNYLALYYRC
jgi:N utilization substance protein B